MNMKARRPFSVRLFAFFILASVLSTPPKTFAGDPVDALSPLGGVPRQLILGPIAIVGDTFPDCNDDGRLLDCDYLSDGMTGEANLLVEEGSEVRPDFGGAACGTGVHPAVNPNINPDGDDGVLTAWVANADDEGRIHYYADEHVGEPPPPGDYVIYSTVYLVNRSRRCLSVLLEVGGDGPFKTILNGRLVMYNSICVGVPPFAGQGSLVEANLHPGKNVVTTAVVRSSNSGVLLRIIGADLQPLIDGSVVSSLIPPEANSQDGFVDKRFGIRRTADIRYGTATVRVSTTPSEMELLLDLYEPTGEDVPDRKPGFVMVHGGALITGSKEDSRFESFPGSGDFNTPVAEYAQEFAKRGYVCAVINYRKILDDPEGTGLFSTLGADLSARIANIQGIIQPFGVDVPDDQVRRTIEAATEDTANAIRWLASNASTFGVDPSRIAVGGWSAGGSTSMFATYAADAPVAAVWSNSSGMWGNEFLIEDRSDPPAILFHGTADMVNPFQGSREVWVRLATVGICNEYFEIASENHYYLRTRAVPPRGETVEDSLARFMFDHMRLAELADDDPVPRILVVGDSWAGRMWRARSVSTALSNRGLAGHDERGSTTALDGSTAANWIQPSYLQRIADELSTFPTIDIVFLSLGGNDVRAGRSISKIVADLETVVDHVLGLRADLKVLLVGYTYFAADFGPASDRAQNDFLARFERARFDLAQRKDRMYYQLNLGLLQAWFGFPPHFEAGEVPFPGGPPDYEPFQGGDPNFLAPPVAFEDDVHLTTAAYLALAERAVEQFLEEWLRNPNCPSSLQAERADQDHVRLTWTNGDITPSSVDIFRDQELIADDAPADPPEYVDVPETRGLQTYRLEFDVTGEACVDLTASVNNTPPCDTHCSGLHLELIHGPGGQLAGVNVRATALATDDTGDVIRYLFQVNDGLGKVAQSGPQDSNVAEFELPPGDYTISVTVSDDSKCAPAADDASREESITVPVAGLFFLRGDCDGSGTLPGAVNDAIANFQDCFTGREVDCLAACDADGDGNACSGVTDGLRILLYVFQSGNPPPAPFPKCGVSRRPEDLQLGCERSGCSS